MKKIDFDLYVRKKTAWVDRNLAGLLPRSDVSPTIIHRAMRYSVFAGGKRLRPMLCLSACEVFGGRPGRDLALTCCALEMLHTFSLIHDDLPCMDDDDLRRGLPTSHKKFGEANAVLAGDALCIHAFELLGRVRTPGVVAETARALGTQGMIGGQVMDIASEGMVVSREKLEYIHRHKTGALMITSLRLGAMIARARTDEIRILTAYGRHIGLCFQIVDDILDVVSTTEQLGKNAGSDQENSKATYPALYGLERSRRLAAEEHRKAAAVLKKLARDTRLLASFADFILERAC